MLGPLKMSTNDAKKAYLRIHGSNFMATDQLEERARILKAALKAVLDSTMEGVSNSTSMMMSSVEKLAPTCKFAVTTMAAVNLSKPIVLRGYSGRSSPMQCTLLDSLVATLSDAQTLPPAVIGEDAPEFFVATTTGNCNPTEALLEETSSIFQARSISVIVSIGSGRPNPVSLSGQGDYTNAVVGLAKSCHAVSQRMESRFSGHPGLFVRLEVDSCDNSGIPHPGEVVSNTRVYLIEEDIRTLLDGLIYSLRYRPKRLEASRVSGIQPGILEEMVKRLNSVLSAGEDQLLEKLNISTDAPFTSSLSANLQRQSCTPGTRISILQLLLDWATTIAPGLNCPLFWLYGLAGTGKTTILHDVCERLQKLNLLASSYFCSIQLTSGDSKYLVPTIVRHLASCSQAFKAAVVVQLQQDPDLYFAGLKHQFQYLLCASWTATTQGNGGSVRKIVVIDALDECDGGEEFLSLLLDAIADGQFAGIRFIVSSRPVPRLLRKIEAIRPEAPQVALHEVPKKEVNGDIKRYFEANLTLPSPLIDELVIRADGLFIYASTLIKFLSSHRSLALIERKRRLEGVLARTPERSSINPLYEQIVNVALCSGDDKNTQNRWDILHAILCAAEPTSAHVVAKLLDVEPQAVTSLVESLYSVLFTTSTGGLIYIFHASFRDFVVSGIDGKFRCRPPRTHSILARACLAEMNRSLRFNICHLESSFVSDADLKPSLDQRIHQYIGDFLIYASRNWLVHLSKCDTTSQLNILPHVQRMLHAKGMFWIEVMSLLGDISGCKEMLKELISASSVMRMVPSISRLALQGAKLVSLFDTLPVKITSHLYLTCLALSRQTPEHTYWKSQFSSLPRVISQQPRGNRYCQVAVSVRSLVHAFVVSPDGKYIVSGSQDKALQIWDADSGKQLRVLEGHTWPVFSVAFSPDGNRLVSGSQDRTIRIWNTQSGEELRILDGHTDTVRSVNFSPDGQQIVSGSDDKTVRIWDAESGKPSRILEGHTNSVKSVAFSPDGKRIVCGFFGLTIHMWDAKSGKRLPTLEGNTSCVCAVIFLPDGKRIISGSDDNTLCLWDAESGKLRRKFVGHTLLLRSVAFSPNGKHVASGSYDRTVRIWDAQSGRELRKLDGHSDSVSSVAFSPDGKRVISGSYDKTIRIWDFQLEEQRHEPLGGHLDPVWSVAFFPDANWIVSGSENDSVCLWNATFGTQFQKFRKCTDSVRSVAVFPDGTRILSGSHDGSIRRWDTLSGEQLRRIEGHSDSVSSIAFSRDGKRIISGSYDRTIRIYGARSGKTRQIIGRPTNRVHAVAFSPDRKHVVGTYDKYIRVWDAESGKRIHKLDGHDDTVGSIAFSPVGELIVSGSYDTSVRIWGHQSGKLLRTLNGHTDNVSSVTFSPDGMRVASGSFDTTIRIWDIQEARQLFKLHGHTDIVRSIAYSPGGARIVSGSRDKTIRIWDAQSGNNIHKLQGHAYTPHSIVFPADIRRIAPVGYPIPKVSILQKLGESFKFLRKPRKPYPSPASPSNTLTMSQTCASLRCREDGRLVTSEEHTGEELLILWIPPSLRPINPSTLLAISTDGFNSIDLAGCVFGEGWDQCYKAKNYETANSLYSAQDLDDPEGR
ncbi:WD40-repeat-containing domain protein [Flagelloscypha sp. PMI_526]|nr:WD40-repeat-containing domain protein [Flagelloscypha sp. PMI_526]